MSGPLCVLVIAAPGRRRDSLSVLLRASYLVSAVWQANQTLSDLAQTTGPPALVLVDTDLSNEQLRSYLQGIRSRWPQARYCLLAHDSEQEHEAVAAGLQVLAAGFQSEALWQMLAAAQTNEVST